MGKLRIVQADTRAGRRALERLAARAGEVLDDKVREGAAKIVESVRKGGDRALLRAVKRLDGVHARHVSELRLVPEGIDAASPDLPPGFAAALERSLAAVERFHRGQVHAGFRLDEGGMELVELRT